MSDRVQGFDMNTADEVIHLRQAAGHRMTPGKALNRSEPRKRHEISEWLHANVGVEQYIDLGLLDLAPGLLQDRTEDDCAFALRTYFSRGIVARLIENKRR